MDKLTELGWGPYLEVMHNKSENVYLRQWSDFREHQCVRQSKPLTQGCQSALHAVLKSSWLTFTPP